MNKKIIAMLLCFAVGLSLGFSGIGREVVSAAVSAINKEDAQLTLVIDAGHGGFDGGASGSDGTLEKDLNLEIALKLREVAEEYPVKVVMTREEDEAVASTKGEDLRTRKQIMEDSEADFAVSIHMNSFPSDTSVYGAQVFYPSSRNDFNSERTTEQNGEQADEQSSKIYAEEVQKSLEINIQDGRERTAMTKENVLLLENPPCSIILVECGFLSNPQEIERLKTAEYQQILAEAIWEGINTELGLEKKTSIPVIDSKNIPEFV